jgi:hypothetical protein
MRIIALSGSASNTDGWMVGLTAAVAVLMLTIFVMNNLVCVNKKAQSNGVHHC